MSFPTFGEGGAQQQPGQEEQGGFEQGGYEQGGGFGAPGAQQQHPMGQNMDPSQQQGQFPGGPQPGGPGAPGPQAGGDQKTTLWYVSAAMRAGSSRS